MNVLQTVPVIDVQMRTQETHPPGLNFRLPYDLSDLLRPRPVSPLLSAADNFAGGIAQHGAEPVLTQGQSGRSMCEMCDHDAESERHVIFQTCYWSGHAIIPSTRREEERHF